MKVVWTRLAEERAVEAVDYIARERPTAASEWLEELLLITSSLDRFPSRGRVVPEIARVAYRELLHTPYRVIYRIESTRVVILTLRHFRRDWDADEVREP
jgi:toxin ParE1/3/4